MRVVNNGAATETRSVGSWLCSVPLATLTVFARAYHASKFAIEAIGDVWRQELDPEGIAVILIEPSAISTPIRDKAIDYLDLDGIADQLASSVSARSAPATRGRGRGRP